MTTFSNADRCYSSLATASLYAAYVDPGPVADIGRARMTLDEEVRQGYDDLEDLAQELYFAQYRLATSVLPPAHEDLGLAATLALFEEHSGGFSAGSVAAQAIATARRALSTLIEMTSSPLGTKVLDLLFFPAAEYFQIFAIEHRVRTQHHIA